MDSDLMLFGRAMLLGMALLCQRVALAFGRLALAAEARYHRLTAAAHG